MKLLSVIILVMIIGVSNLFAEAVRSPFISELDRQKYADYIKKEEERRRLEYNRKIQQERRQMQMRARKREDKNRVQKYIEKDLAVLFPDLEIQGIIWEGDSPVVLINDKLYKVNDKINDEIKLMSVSKKGVALLYKDSIYDIDVYAEKDSEKPTQEDEGYIEFNVL